MNEHNNVLRMVTTLWQNDGGVKNMLHTLQEATDRVELETLATLPNSDNPQAIGKPNETIRSVRFLGDEAYIVTFQQTDPLYKVDLTDPTKPQIKGELEMTGFSAYLHRISDQYLLGVGYSATETGRITGIQTTVFDTSGDNPTIVSQDTIQNPDQSGWVQLPIAQDSRAITTLQNDTSLRIAFPFSYSGYINGEYTHSKLAGEYVVDINTGKLTTRQQRQLVGFDNNYSSQCRAMMDGNDIYYNTYEGAVKKYTWGEPSVSEPLAE